MDRDTTRSLLAGAVPRLIPSLLTIREIETGSAAMILRDTLYIRPQRHTELVSDQSAITTSRSFGSGEKPRGSARLTPNRVPASGKTYPLTFHTIAAKREGHCPGVRLLNAGSIANRIVRRGQSVQPTLPRLPVSLLWLGEYNLAIKACFMAGVTREVRR